MAGKRHGNGVSTIRLRADGRWEARDSLPEGGQHSLFGKTRADLAERLNKALADRSCGMRAQRAERPFTGITTPGALSCAWGSRK